MYEEGSAPSEDLALDALARMQPDLQLYSRGDQTDRRRRSATALGSESLGCGARPTRERLFATGSEEAQEIGSDSSDAPADFLFDSKVTGDPDGSVERIGRDAGL